MIYDIINSWGTDMNFKNEYLPETLSQKYPLKCYYIDFFPKSVSEKYAHKFDQVEKEVYKTIYSRMYNCILKLWIYDDVYYESDLLKKKSFFLSKNIINPIEKKSHLHKLFRLSEKNKIDLTLVFKELQLVIIPSWTCFFIFANNESSLSFIEKILKTEGLHLRK